MSTVVLGGTGKTGRRVVERLRARGLPVLPRSRSTAPARSPRSRPATAPAA
jgi:uncharacterized protein YbjT (DUF2867 family)